jgi:choline dehydrogenase
MSPEPNTTFDYVIVGGGTAGLVLANRLSVFPHVRVAVIEPGGDERANPDVTSSGWYMKAFGTDVDWMYMSVPQAHAAGRAMEYHSGKAIGGTSTINGKPDIIY